MHLVGSHLAVLSPGRVQQSGFPFAAAFVAWTTGLSLLRGRRSILFARQASKAGRREGAASRRNAPACEHAAQTIVSDDVAGAGAAVPAGAQTGQPAGLDEPGQLQVIVQ